MEEKSKETEKIDIESQIVGKAKELMEQDRELDKKTAILKAIIELDLYAKVFETCMLFDLTAGKYVEYIEREMTR